MEHYEQSLPRNKKAKVELWKYLSPTDIEQLLKSFQNTDDVLKNRDYENCKQVISEKFRLNPTSDRRDTILVDKYYFLIKFCSKHEFNREQTSALIYTLTKLHELMKSTAYGNIDQCYVYLKQMIILYSVYRPPYSLKLFEPEEAKLVLDYFVNTYLKHFKLYKLIFTPAIKLDLKFKYSNKSENDDSEQQNEKHVEEAQQHQQRLESVEEIENKRDGSLSKEEDKATVDLKEFIKEYLTKKIEKVKENIVNEMKEQDIELNKKLSQTSRTTPTTPKKGAKKGK